MPEIIGSWRNIPWQFPMDLQDRELFDDFDFWGEIYGGGDDGEEQEQEEKPEEDLDFMEFSKKWTN